MWWRKKAFSVSAAGVTLIHSVRLIFQQNHKHTERDCVVQVSHVSGLFSLNH